MELRKKDYDISLFERLVKSDFPKAMLEVQQRMHSSIADLTRHFYNPPFTDHPRVNAYPDIPGIPSRVFWITHSVPEDPVPPDAFLLSKSHTLEARFAALLARYIVQQGVHSAKRITLVSAYLHQVRLMRQQASEHAELTGVKIVTVDNYQGEENDVLILSLVRSNAEGRTGFSVEENRAIVALSRARHALYIVGNRAMFEEHDAWVPVLTLLRERCQIGEILRLYCGKHPGKATAVTVKSDFVDVRWGGCSAPCGLLLDCGHACRMMCHPVPHQPSQCVQVRSPLLVNLVVNNLRNDNVS
jgi:hypothetical protein